jgi:hypothetical protein
MTGTPFIAILGSGYRKCNIWNGRSESLPSFYVLCIKGSRGPSTQKNRLPYHRIRQTFSVQLRGHTENVFQQRITQFFILHCR